VTIICGSLLQNSIKLRRKGIHPTINSESFYKASILANEFLEKNMGISINLNDHKTIIKVANTSLGSKIVSCCSQLFSQIVIDCISQIFNSERPDEMDLRDIKVLKKIGGTLDDSEIIYGLVLDYKTYKVTETPQRIENAKICLAQFHISSPKSNIDSSVVVGDYKQMDQSMREERKYIIQTVKSIKETGCNVLLIQKSILRESVSELGEHYLAKAGILLVKTLNVMKSSLFVKLWAVLLSRIFIN